MRTILASVMGGMILVSLVGCQASPNEAGGSNWKQTVAQRLPELGHRNWIVIADSAYPSQTRSGIETVVTGADQIEVVKHVLAALDHSAHIKPIVYADAELASVPENDAPGIEAYRSKLAKVLGNRTVNTMPHEEMIAKLDQVGQTFKVLVLKTNLALPYTSVFLQLDCRYWNADAEQRLRAAFPLK